MRHAVLPHQRLGVADRTQIHTHMCYSEFNDILRPNFFASSRLTVPSLSGSALVNAAARSASVGCPPAASAATENIAVATAVRRAFMLVGPSR